MFVGFVSQLVVSSQLTTGAGKLPYGRIPLSKMLGTQSIPYAGFMIWQKVGNGDLGIRLQTIDQRMAQSFEIKIKDADGQILSSMKAFVTGNIFIDLDEYQRICLMKASMWEFTEISPE